MNLAPNITFEKTGAASGIVHGDNGMGQYVCNEGLDYAIDLGKESGVAAVGVEKTGHSGMLGT